MSLTNPDKIVTEERLNEYHNTILPYLGGMPDIMANKFSRGDLYSTDEKMIGRWIDKKPIYQKNLPTVALPSSGEISIDVSSLSISDLIDVSGHSGGYGNNSARIPYYDGAADYVHIYFNYSQSAIIITHGNGAHMTGMNLYITIQYTKTTDSAIEIGNDTDYSTTEKIVGTWFDKPLYQKTITGLDAPVQGSRWNNVCDISALSIQKIIKADFISSGNDPGGGTLVYAIRDGYLAVYNTVAWSTNISTATIQYTKTTD